MKLISGVLYHDSIAVPGTNVWKNVSMATGFISLLSGTRERNSHRSGLSSFVTYAQMSKIRGKVRKNISGRPSATSCMGCRKTKNLPLKQLVSEQSMPLQKGPVTMMASIMSSPKSTATCIPSISILLMKRSLSYTRSMVKWSSSTAK